MIKIISLLSFSFLVIQNSSAQQDPQVTQYMFNRLYFNPAFAGAANEINSAFMFRNQWVGFSGNPVTTNFSIDAPLDKIKSGVGGTVLYEQLGGEKTLITKAAYSFKIIKNEAHNLSIGLDAGIINKKFMQTWVSNNPNDPVISGSGGTAFDISGGFFYQGKKGFAALSSTHLTQPGIDFYRVARHYYFISGVDLPISEKISVQPSFLFKSDFSSGILDLNINLFLFKTFYLGSGYRINGDIIFIAGSTLKGFTISYSYDYITSVLAPYTKGSHEIVLRYKHLKKAS